MGFSRASSLSDKTADRAKTEDEMVVSQERLGRLEENPSEEDQEVDAVFGAGGEGKVNYRTVGWLSTSVLLTKAQIGLGVLSLPSTFATLGLGPGLIILFWVAIVTTYTDYYLAGPWKRNHPECYSVSDAGRIMFGPIGGEIMGAGYMLFMTFVVGAAFVGLATAFNAISLHATCTAVWVAVALIVTYPIASLRTLGSIKWVGWVGLASMVVSILLVTIAVGAGNRPSIAPQEGPWDKGLVMWGNPSFADAMNAVANLLLSYGGTAIYLPIASEMRNPRHSTRAILLSQSFITAFYVTIGVVVYYFAGQYVASPALGTAGTLIKRVAYGLALPGLFAAAVIYSHLPAKWVFVRVLRKSRHLTESTPTHWATWLGCTAGCCIFSYIIAEAIPVFGGLVGLIGAVFVSLLALFLPCACWMYDNLDNIRDSSRRTFKIWAMLGVNVGIMLSALLILGGGAYGAGVAIRDDYQQNGGRPWSCADNSNST
ncbi:hypothetical protein JCM8097_005425 [Rhodosporidiobolus ruineniae]